MSEAQPDDHYPIPEYPETPDMQVVSSSEPATEDDTEILARRFIRELETPAFTHLSDSAKAESLPFAAAIFMNQQLANIPPDKRGPIFVLDRTLDTVLERFTSTYPAQSISQVSIGAREFLSYYGEIAADYEPYYREVEGTLLLLEQAKRLGSAEAVYAATVLLAAYGRAREIVDSSGLRTARRPTSGSEDHLNGV